MIYKRVQFYLKLHNHGRRSRATAIIDKITVSTDECDISGEPAKSKSPKLHSVADMDKASLATAIARATTVAPNTNSSFGLLASN